MKILHAPVNVANQGWALAHGLRALGHEAEVWQYGESKYGFPSDRTIPFPPERPNDLWRLVDEALERFDAYHFHFGRSLVPYQTGALPALWDLPLYREARKPVFFTFHGTDARLKSKHLQIDKWSYFRDPSIPCDEDDIQKRMRIIRTYASEVFVSSPIDFAFVEDASFHPRAIVLEDYAYVGPVRAREPLVVHAPSSRNTKGTTYVLEAVEKLRADGVDFEFRLIEGMSSAEVRKIMQDADVLVDTLGYADYGVAGIEAMAMGKTVITRLDPVIPETVGKVPLLEADPETVGEVLRRAVRDDGLRKSLAPKAREFVERTHDAKVVAATLLRSYEKTRSYFQLSFPDWASLGTARRAERLEEVVLEMQTQMRGTAARVRRERGRFSRFGARIDVALRKLKGLLRGKRS
jgi:glycosyltransferase involved in cell wall biosynthesis